MIFRKGSLKVGILNGILLALPFWILLIWLLFKLIN